MRYDLGIVARMIGHGQNVLDLGCGDGELLETVIRDQGCRGVGVETDPEDFHACIARGVPVTQGDLEKELPATATGAYDVAVLSLTLQAVRRPDRVLGEMARVAPRMVISLPNFGQWRLRASLTLKGKMPVTPLLPYEWYDTPNIHLCTLSDFESLMGELGIRVRERVLLDAEGRQAGPAARLAPNLLAEGAIYSLESP